MMPAAVEKRWHRFPYSQINVGHCDSLMSFILENPQLAQVSRDCEFRAGLRKRDSEVHSLQGRACKLHKAILHFGRKGVHKLCIFRDEQALLLGLELATVAKRIALRRRRVLVRQPCDEGARVERARRVRSAHCDLHLPLLRAQDVEERVRLHQRRAG